MSRIYFHAEHRTAEVGGSERAYFGGMADALALALLRLDPSRDHDWIREITVNPPDYLAEALAAPQPDVTTNPDAYFRWARWVEAWKTWARVGNMSGREGGIRVGEKVIPFGDLALNTLIAMNSPQLAFAAHMHGCCEIHGWVAKENAGWLAEVIEKGRRENIFRAGQGWEDVIELAGEVESGMDGPIVMSYSVCDQFPNSEVADWEAPVCDACKDGEPSEKDRADGYEACSQCGGAHRIYDAWYELDDHRQWELGVLGLIDRDWPFAMGPDRQGQGFLSGESVFDLLATRWSGQLQPKA